MRRINCYIPIKLSITGRLTDQQLEQLSDTLVHALSARIAFAERTINPRRTVSETVIVDPAREPVDAERFDNQTYQLPSYDNHGRNTGVPVLPSGSSTTAPEAAESLPELPLLSDFHDYAFFFTGGAYGHAAEEYIREFYPDHHRFQARSFQEMFHLLLVDIRRRTREAGHRQHVSEIVIVTHANAEGGMKIPLTQDNRRRVFTPNDLADLQQEFRRGLHQRFQAERREVVAALDESTRIVVRGCNIGQSQEALDALRAFFGGSPTVFAPRGYQGFEVIPIGRSFLRTPVEAFDFLVQQGYLPADQINLPAQEKERYIRENFGNQIPAEFFVTSEEHSRRLRALPTRQRLGGGEAEQYMIRPDEHTSWPLLPGAGEFWGTSAALPRYLQPDPELDSLSIEELEDRARALHNPYRPQNAAMLIRLANAWSRRSAERPFRNEDFSGTDPLSGLPDIRIFGDPNILASDAARFPGATRPQPDIFETETLTRRTRTPEELARAQDFTEEEQTVEAVASAGVTHSRRASFGSVGRVDTLTDGLRLWNFASNSARLRTQFETPLRQLAVQALTNPLLRFEIDGHTDSAGAPTNNARLSEQRALAVAQFLINTGVPASRIRTQAFGENNPVAVEHRAGGAVSLEGMARNRRVEIRVTTLGGQTVDEEVLRRARQQGGTLGTQARPERIPGNYDSIDWYTVGGIATDVIAELSSYGVLAPAWELMAFVGPVLNIIGLVDSLNTAQGQQERGNRRRGIVLGLRTVGGMSRSTDLSVNITAAQLERMIHTDWWLEREWLSQITYSYPLGPQGAIANMRHGLRQVATRVNEGMRTTERYFRHRLEQTGMSPQDIETVYNHEIQRIRRQVLDEMLTAAFRALGP